MGEHASRQQNIELLAHSIRSSARYFRLRDYALASSHRSTDSSREGQLRLSLRLEVCCRSGRILRNRGDRSNPI